MSSFFERVWDVVAEIPLGRVTTYGHIAASLGSPRAARTVGWAMQAAGDKALPCHRVVARDGTLSAAMRFEGPEVMEERLRGEGVSFTPDGRVDMKSHLWIPDAQNR